VSGYNIPFFNRRDDDPQKWLDKQDRDSTTAYTVINAISERLDKGELAP
jgi:hypothetical protein